MSPKALPAMLGYVLSGGIAVAMAIIILRTGRSSDIECIGLRTHCPYDGASKWMMLTAALAIAADIAFVANLLIGKARKWLNERDGNR